MAKLDARRYGWQPPVKFFVIGSAAAVAASNDDNGNPTQWVYQVTQLFKAGLGYTQWTEEAAGDGYAGDGYNFIEDNNDGSGAQGNGVDHDGDDYPSGFKMSACPTGTVVPGVLVPAPGAGGITTLECWFAYENGEDGDC